MTSATRYAIADYDISIDDGMFTVNLPFTAYAHAWDMTFSSVLSRLSYVTGTALIEPTSPAFPYRLVVTVSGPLTWTRIEHMSEIVRQAHDRNIGPLGGNVPALYSEGA